MHEEEVQAAGEDKSRYRKDKIGLKEYYNAWDKLDVDSYMEEGPKGGTTTDVRGVYEKNEGARKEKNVSIQVVRNMESRRYKQTSEYEEVKNEGNEYYKQREYEKSIEKYSEGIVI